MNYTFAELSKIKEMAHLINEHDFNMKQLKEKFRSGKYEIRYLLRVAVDHGHITIKQLEDITNG